MNCHCTHCGKELSEGWEYCPHCGRQNAKAPAFHAAPEREEAPSEGAYGGLAYGVVAAPILVIAGMMICLTGWGIFLGAPLILVGILAPLAGTLFGIGEHRGKCPRCGMRVITGPDHRAHACPHCGEAFAVTHNGQLTAH